MCVYYFLITLGVCMHGFIVFGILDRFLYVLLGLSPMGCVLVCCVCVEERERENERERERERKREKERERKRV